MTEYHAAAKTGIGWAVAELRKGNQVRRRGWNGKGQYLDLVEEEPEHKILSSVWITTVDGFTVPWLCSQTDLLADDWEVVG